MWFELFELLLKIVEFSLAVTLLILGFLSPLGTEKAEAKIVIEELYLFVIYHYYTVGTGQRPISFTFIFLF